MTKVEASPQGAVGWPTVWTQLPEQSREARNSASSIAGQSGRIPQLSWRIATGDLDAKYGKGNPQCVRTQSPSTEDDP